MSSFYRVQIAGLTASVPHHAETAETLVAQFPGENLARTIQSIGVQQRRIAPSTICTSDLCFAAAESLFKGMGIDRNTIDGLIFVSQTPDYILPATACNLQHRLQLLPSVAAMDVNLGCSGYVYGLWLCASLIESKACKRVLLLVGDTVSKFISPEDKSVVPVFGDGGSATLLEANDLDAHSLHFVVGTDGSGSERLIIPQGGFRNPRPHLPIERTVQSDGNIRSQEDLYMDGGEIFNFTLREVPEMIRAVMVQSNWEPHEVDGFVMHQANRFMLEHLRKRMKIEPEKFPYSLEDFGNTSSASIPITLVKHRKTLFQNSAPKLILAGFGVGLSWGAVAWESKNTYIGEMVEI